MNDAPVLICDDGSEESRRAVDRAAELLVERRAVVLAVAPPLTAKQAYTSLGEVPPVYEEFNLGDAARHAENGAQYARSAGLAAEARGELGSPTWEGIVNVADELDAAVIVVGSRGLTAFHELLEGSVSHQVAARAGRPVLIVPPHRASADAG